MRVTKMLLGLAYILMLVSCQTAAPAPTAEPEKLPVSQAPAEPLPSPASDTIAAARDGFSPRAASPAHTLSFSIHWARPSDVSRWEVRFAAGAEPVRILEGTDTPTTVTWDGKDDTGDFPAPGRYRAELRWAGSDGTWIEAAQSPEFLLDLVPPYGALSVTPNPFTEGTVTIKLDIVSGDSDWTVWRLAVFHPDGRRFRDFISEDHRSDQVVWDGRAVNNAGMEPGVTYRLEAEVFDVYGNRGTISTTLSKLAAAPLVVTLDGARLAELPVYFAPFSADLTAVPPEEKAVNEASLASLAEMLKAAGRVVIVGHANQVFYDDPARAAVEQATELLPLSLARSEAVLRSLVALGVPAETLEARGVGALDPVAPFWDADNRWKNRRVVIELTSS